jgi:segregation and condensation protein A
MTFRDLTARSTSTAHVVACFLALLELYKRAMVDLDQVGTFGELTVVWTAASPTGPGEVSVDDDDQLVAAPARASGARHVPDGAGS